MLQLYNLIVVEYGRTRAASGNVVWFVVLSDDEMKAGSRSPDLGVVVELSSPFIVAFNFGADNSGLDWRGFLAHLIFTFFTVYPVGLLL